MRACAICALLFALTCPAQQRIQFHAAQMKAEWVFDPTLGYRGGWIQRVTGPLPESVRSQMVYAGAWEIFTKRVSDRTGLSWQAREILREGEWIDVDAQGNITVEVSNE